jgi:hypothetical protein
MDPAAVASVADGGEDPEMHGKIMTARAVLYAAYNLGRQRCMTESN